MKPKAKPIWKQKQKPPKDPKPCPECYLPMRLEADVWACAKHGEPTRP